jgi:hypothetical protein
MTRTNRIAAACGVMLCGLMATSYKSEPVAATIINDPAPAPELAEVSPPPAEPQGTAEGQEAPAVEDAEINARLDKVSRDLDTMEAKAAKLKPRTPAVPDAEDAEPTPPNVAAVEWQYDWTEAMNLAVSTDRKVCFILSSSDRGCPPCEALLTAIGPTFDAKYGADWVLCPLKKSDAWLKAWKVTGIPTAWLVQPIVRGDELIHRNLATEVVDAASLAKLLEKNG